MNRDSTGDKLINFPPGYRLSASPYLAINRVCTSFHFFGFCPMFLFLSQDPSQITHHREFVKCPMAPPGRHSFQGFFSITLTGLRSIAQLFCAICLNWEFSGVFLATRLGVVFQEEGHRGTAHPHPVSPRVRTFLTSGQLWAEAELQLSLLEAPHAPHALL